MIVTAVIQGLNQTTGSKKYGPVSMADLTTAAQTVAREVTAKIVYDDPAGPAANGRKLPSARCRRDQ